MLKYIMNYLPMLKARLLLLFFIINFLTAGEMLVWEQDEKSIGVALRNKVETFYGANTNLLSGSDLDRLLYVQSTWDFTLETAVSGVLKSRGVGRLKSRWGSPTIIRTTEAITKVADADQKPHSHTIGKQLPWIREAWVEINLNKALNIDSECKQVFKAGSFSFKLGRGISLGDAYAVNPGVLGFYSNDSIDQYAFAFLMHGDIQPKLVTYDAYFSILENKTDSLKEVTAQIYLNEIGRINNPFRGFGHINFVLAGRLQIYPFCNSQWPNLLIEPYVMYNNNPEQKIEFIADASFKMATPGIMFDYVGERINWNFEVAFNVGSQNVKGWDRDLIASENRDGYVVNSFTQVKDGDAANSKDALVTSSNKLYVSSSPQGVEFNGQQILYPSTDGYIETGLYNSKYRFTPAYKNKLAGFMFVGDLACWLIPDQLRWAGTVALATGDDNPNKDYENFNDSSVDGVYNGFVPFQEIYTGKYIDSVFILGSSSIPRPMTVPTSTGSIPKDSVTANNTSGFTNLVYFGQGLQVTPVVAPGLKLRPNVIAYWQQSATKKSIIVTGLDGKPYVDISKDCARKFLGTEINLFLDWNIIKALKAYFVGGMFFPGDHYKDRSGLVGLDKDQLDLIIGKSKLGVPLLGSSVAYSLNGGFEYIF